MPKVKKQQPYVITQADLLANFGHMNGHQLDAFIKTGEKPEPTKLVLHNHASLIKAKYQEVKAIFAGTFGLFLRHPGIFELHSWRGIGKTNVALYLADAMTRLNAVFLRWKCVSPMRVHYFEGELPGAVTRERVLYLVQASPNFSVTTFEDMQGGFPSIATKEGQEVYVAFLLEHEIEVVIFDSLSTLANVSMNEEENIASIKAFFMRLRGLGISVIFTQHDGKKGAQRGHSSIEDPVDLSIHLTGLGGVGLHVQVHLDKVRHDVKDAFPDMDLVLTTEPDDQNKPKWVWGDMSESEVKVAERRNELRTLLEADPEAGNKELKAALRKLDLGGKDAVLQKLIAEVRAEVKKALTGVVAPAVEPEPVKQVKGQLTIKSKKEKPNGKAKA